MHTTNSLFLSKLKYVENGRITEKILFFKHYHFVFTEPSGHFGNNLANKYHKHTIIRTDTNVPPNTDSDLAVEIRPIFH